MESNAVRRLQSVRDATERDIAALADRQARKAVASASSQDGLGNAAEAARTACLEELLAGVFVAKVAAAAHVDEPALGLMAYDLRRLAPPVGFNRPVSMETRLRGLVLAAVVGCVAGMLAGVPLSLWLTGERILGLVLGGPAGAAAVVLAVGRVARSKRLRRTIQVALGFGAGASVLAGLSPMGLWRRLSLGRGSCGVVAMAKTVALFLFAIVALQLAAPKERTAQQDCQEALRRRLHEWLRHATDLLAFLAISQHAATEAHEAADAPKEDTRILRSVQKLSLASTDREMLCVAKEIAQQYRIAGFTFRAPDSSPNVFDLGAKELYEEEDRIEDGDEFHVLVPPVMRDGKVLLKGRIARKRG